MPRLVPFLLSACLCAPAIPLAAAELNFDYDLRAGHSSNLFEDTNKLSGSFVEAEGKLRGTIDIDGSDFTYALWHREKRLSRYHFGNENATGVNLGYKTKLGDNVTLTLEGAASRTTDGDVLVAVPGTVVGYRSTDLNYALAGSLAAEFWGGKNTLTATVNQLDRGKAKFTTNLLLPSKIEADVTSMDLTATHIRPALSGEVGFTVAYRSSYVPTLEQTKLSRFPASVLRGSIAYGRQLAPNLTLIAEFGATAIDGDELGSNVRRVRPYLHTALEWKATDRLGLAAGYDRDFGITDIDDPLGEYIGTWKLAAGLKLTDSLNAKLAYEIASSEWMYYLYNTETRRLVGTVSWQFAKNHRLELEYRHIDRNEKNDQENFTSQQYLARVAGSF
jgi:hypothetical protein